jgi:6,7-dimethyl-8-ribityllumazine synthase
MRPRLAPKATLSFAIVASQYNEEFTQPLIDHTHQELNILEPGATVSLTSTPGAFEIPLAVQTVAELDRYQAIIALGVILEGQTEHAALIAQNVTRALLDISLAHRIPVIHAVLLVKNAEQARARCIDQELNRGIEAARAAVSAARAIRDIK